MIERKINRITFYTETLPSEGVEGSGAVGALLDEGLVELPAGLGMSHTPAVLAEVPETGDVTTEEGSKLPPAVFSITFVTQLIIQHVRLYFDLGGGDIYQRV